MTCGFSIIHQHYFYTLSLLLQDYPAPIGNNAIDDAVGNAILSYAHQNGVTNDGTTGKIEAWYVDADSNVVCQAGVHALTSSNIGDITGVQVTLNFTDTTTFMKVVGQDEMGVQTTATAMYGPVTQMGGGILPIAVPLEVVEALDYEKQFHMLDTNQHAGGSFCTDPSDLDTCIGDPASHNAHRGWLNLNYIYNTEHIPSADPLYRTFEQEVPNRPCGSDPSISTDDGLRGWAGKGCPYPFPIFSGHPPAGDGTVYVDGDFIHGDPGARDSSAQQVVADYLGETVYLPIFDHIYMSDYMDDNFTQPEDIGWPRAGGGGHAFLYHIVGFVAVEVDAYEHNHYPDTGNTKSLVGSFQSAIIGQGQISPNSGPLSGSGGICTASLYGVILWK